MGQRQNKIEQNRIEYDRERERERKAKADRQKDSAGEHRHYYSNSRWKVY